MPRKSKSVPWKDLGGRAFLKPLKDLPYEKIADEVEKACGMRPDRAIILNTLGRYGLERKWKPGGNNRVPWQELGGKDFLKPLKDKPFDEIADKVEKACGIRPSKKAVECKLSDYNLTRSSSRKENKKTLEKEIREQLSAYIAEGALANEKIGLERLYKILRDEFADRLKEAKLSFTKTNFPALVDEVYWTKERLGLLEEVLQSGLPDPIDEFCNHIKTCPREMIEKRAEHLRGVTSRVVSPAEFLPGLGRLDISEIDPEDIYRFKLPEASAENPYTVDIPDTRFNVSIVNGPNIGLAYDIDIERNVPRRAFAESRIRDSKAIVMSGLLDIDLKKAAGPLKVHRALVSGLKVKPETLEVTYQEEAKRILKDRKNVSKKDTELLYLTVAERLELVVDAWHKIAHRPKNHKCPEKGIRPEFDGPVLIIFGYKEEELITSAAYWEARWLKIWQEGELATRIKLKNQELKEAKESNRTSDVIERLEDEKLALERRKARTIVSNISEEDLTRQFRRIFPLVVKKIESVIPNSKVIGMGTSYVRFRDKKIEFNVPDHTRPTTTLLANYTKGYGPKVLRGNMADSVVIMHPHAVSYRSVDRSRDENGERKSLLVHVAPITIDGDFLRKKLRNTVRKVHPISKLIFTEEFKPGMMMLDFHNGLIDGYQVDVNALARHEEREKKKDGKWTRARIPLMHDPVIRYINLVTTTDLHYGSRNRQHMWAPDLGQYVGCDEALFLLLKRAGLCGTSRFPFHMYAMNDDGIQGNHLKLWQQQPSPNEMPLSQVEKTLENLQEQFEKAKTKGAQAKILEQMRKLALKQFSLRPSDLSQTQLELLCEKHVDNNVEIFDSILSSAVGAGLTFRGVSDFEGTPCDKRDLACINSGSGNHGTKSFQGEMTEGWIISRCVWSRLLQKQKWQKFGEETLRRLVRAPLYSNMFMAWGTVQAPSGYEWAFDLRDSPPKMKGWYDTLAGWVFIDPSRANYTRLFNSSGIEGEPNRVVIKTCGDKHFHAAAHTPYAIYVMGAPCTHTDQFAEMAGGLPPNSTGITSICLPKDGPDSGPILVRFFPYERLKYFVEHPEVPVDFDAMFPNPL